MLNDLTGLLHETHKFSKLGINNVDAWSFLSTYGQDLKLPKRNGMYYCVHINLTCA